MPLLITLLAAFLAALLSGLGVGSAGLFVLYLTFVAGLEQAAAQGVNLLFFLFSAGGALTVHLRQRVIPRRLVLFLCAAALPGAVLGHRLLGLISPHLLRRLFGGMLILAGGLVFLQKSPRSTEHTQTPPSG